MSKLIQSSAWAIGHWNSSLEKWVGLCDLWQFPKMGQNVDIWMVAIQRPICRTLTRNRMKKLAYCHWLPQTNYKRSATSPQQCYNKDARNALHLDEQKSGYNFILAPYLQISCKLSCIYYVTMLWESDIKHPVKLSFT